MKNWIRHSWGRKIGSPQHAMPNPGNLLSWLIRHSRSCAFRSCFARLLGPWTPCNQAPLLLVVVREKANMSSRIGKQQLRIKDYSAIDNWYSIAKYMSSAPGSEGIGSMAWFRMVRWKTMSKKFLEFCIVNSEVELNILLSGAELLLRKRAEREGAASRFQKLLPIIKYLK